MNHIEDTLERVLTCQDCPDSEIESLLYHEARWHYEFYEYDMEDESFTCRNCRSKNIKEEFETVDEDGNIMPYEQVNGNWFSAEELMKISEMEMRS